MNNLADWLSRLEQQHPRAIELGLDRVAVVHERLNAAKPAAQVISVAGTNGKGSTVAYIDAIARACGWRCGAYTSPHVLRFNERIAIDGTAVIDQDLCTAFAEVDAARREISLTYFEFTTLAAFVLFGRAGLDLAILEVGLGGRLDAVNIIDPDVAVITTIGMDHQDWLGNDRESIGFEKAGIMRAQTPLICGERDLPASVIEHAACLGVNMQVIDKDFDWLEIVPTMIGIAQKDNLAVACAALQSLPQPPQNLATKSIIQGAGVSLPGRIELLQQSPAVYCDVAHNVQAAKQLAQSVAEQTPAGAYRLVLAMLEDKEVELVANCMDGLAGKWYLAGLDSPRGLSGDQLENRLAGHLKAPVSRHDSVTGAISAALAEASDEDVLVIFGSFLTVAEAFHYWKR